ncbi:MAG TPA: response regulator [Bryobacteraceae bacterium]|nr:response regulator [Bryobacteraceae bacterium]
MVKPRRVLLVDDEAPLLRLVENFLTRNGYETEAFDQPLDALAHFGADPQRFQLVIADVTMPELSGVELVKRLAELSADVHMLLLSGLPLNVERFPESVRRRLDFLQKPFLPRMLLDSVRQIEERMARNGHASESAC